MSSYSQNNMSTKQEDVVKKNPQLRAVIPLFALFPIYFVYLISNLPSAVRSGNTLAVVSSLVVIVVWSGVFVFAIIRLLFLRRIERRRQAAARGDARFLAEEQPAENIDVVQPPFTIALRTNWRAYFIFIGVISLLVLFLMAIFVAADAFFLRAVLPLFIGIILVAVACFIVLVVAVSLLLTRSKEEITATAYGLIKKNGATTEQIAWHEARLFAIDVIPNATKYPYPAAFEVAGKDQVVNFQWVHKYNGGLSFFFAKPLLPYEEYDRQMWILLTIINRQTGLPLCDVRKSL